MGRPGRVAGRAVAAGLLAFLILGAVLLRWRVSRALQLSREEVRSENIIAVRTGRYSPPAETGFEVVSAPAVLLQAARFQDHLYIAGPAGLLQYDLTGGLVRQFSAGRELPSSALVAIARARLADSSEPELILATVDEGLLAYDGRNFRQIYPQAADARGITAILPVAGGHLLLATRKRGVLLYDGKQITPLHPSLSKQYVTALAGNESDLWVGTLNDGVLHWHAGVTEPFGEAQGLPDRQVLSITVAGEKVFVGTAMGVAAFEGGRFARVLAPGVLTTAVLSTGVNLLVGSEDQGVLTIPLEARGARARITSPAGLAEVRQFFEAGDGHIYVLTRNALYRMAARGGGWRPLLQPDGALLSDRNISALAADKDGRLWVGYFDRGLDLLEIATGRTRHIENEHVFCINRILADSSTGTVAVATANGLLRFSATGSQQQVLTRADGLIADHVTDIVPYREGLAVATPAGLTLLDSSGARSLYAFHGLVSNHVYALAAAGDQLLVGTLGGLSVVRKEAVQAGFTAGRSGLKHNWITAVVPVGDRWMVGTYGAGIVSLDPDGRFHSFDLATAPFEVNPNAMLVTERSVFAGSLGKGLFVYDRTTGRWTAIRDGLPSANVTALAASNGYLYVGTDNGLVRIQERKLLP